MRPESAQRRRVLADTPNALAASPSVTQPPDGSGANSRTVSLRCLRCVSIQPGNVVRAQRAGEEIALRELAPSAASSDPCSTVSTPSPTIVSPSDCAIAVTASMIERLEWSAGSKSLMNARSSLMPEIGKRVR